MCGSRWLFVAGFALLAFLGAGCNRGGGLLQQNQMGQNPMGAIQQRANQLAAGNRNLNSQMLTQLNQLQTQTNSLQASNQQLLAQLEQQRREFQEQLARSQQVATRQVQDKLPQFQDFQRRASELDLSNQGLHTEIARTRQELQQQKELVVALQKRLAETANQLRTAQVAKQDSDRRVEAMQASTRLRGGATISANNSLRQQLQMVDIPGLEVRADGDVVRMEIPADRIFTPGTVQFQPGAYQILDQVAAAISANYSRQIVGIEGHCDPSPLAGGATHHQLTAAQAQAAFDQLTRRNRLPVQQIFVMGMGANRPRFSNTTPGARDRNRRLEVVIYPETIGG